jgi:hypothetical protein
MAMAGELKRLSRDTKLLQLQHRRTQDLPAVVLVALSAALTAGTLFWNDAAEPVEQGAYYLIAPLVSLALFTVLLAFFLGAWSMALRRWVLLVSSAILVAGGIAFADADDMGRVVLHYFLPALCMLGAALSLRLWRPGSLIHRHT